jgi:hypothetical protein
VDPKLKAASKEKSAGEEEKQIRITTKISKHRPRIFTSVKNIIKSAPQASIYTYTVTLTKTKSKTRERREKIGRRKSRTMGLKIWLGRGKGRRRRRRGRIGTFIRARPAAITANQSNGEGDEDAGGTCNGHSSRGAAARLLSIHLGTTNHI